MFRKPFGLGILLLTLTLLASNTQAAEGKLKALIIDGQNNHSVWPKSTIMMRQYLIETGLYTVDIARTKYVWKAEKHKDMLPHAGVGESVLEKKPKADPDFKPDFAKYNVVISNFGNAAALWPEVTRKAFVDYMKNGGGFVSIHAANNSFGDWPEYNEIIGIGGWGGRGKVKGDLFYKYYNKLGEIVRENKKDKIGTHGPKWDFPITIRDDKHPITQGLPKTWLHAKDELYAFLKGPANMMTILGTAAPKKFPERHEPMLMTIEYGKGRTFHSTLGHDEVGFECVGFIITFKRGVEWAATGKVTQTEVPEDFPTAEAVSTRTFELKSAS